MGINNAAEMLEVAKEECGRLEREVAGLRSEVDQDERILAWDAIASHPFFRECYSTDGTLLAAMVDKLNAASQIPAERDERDWPKREQRVTRKVCGSCEMPMALTNESQWMHITPSGLSSWCGTTEPKESS